MRILFDQGTPAPLRSLLVGHQVVTAHERGWSQLANGDLLVTAEAEGFDALVTTDRNLKYQQNLTGRKIAILVLSTTSWPRIQAALEPVVAAVAQLVPGAFVELDIP
jgi:predicted nuclease of predicted toxin-antitoxin system